MTEATRVLLLTVGAWFVLALAVVAIFFWLYGGRK